MSNLKIGRNEPCHCGSGKKYKRCCLAADERQAAVERAAAEPELLPPLRPSDPEPVRLPPVQEIPKLLREMARLAPEKGQDGIQKLLADAQTLCAYLERKDAIEAASSALEAHRADFERLTENTDAFLERTRALFAEKPFEPLRFKADEVERAFEGTGPTLHMMEADKFVETVRKVILRLADKKRRSEMSMRLLLELPNYVDAGRDLDAWILQQCAYMTSDQPEDSNPFLFQMFTHGYDAWVAKQTAHDRDMLSELGIDMSRIENMNMDEIDAWIEQQQADPARKAKLEAILQAHPDQQKMVEANCEEMERNAASLFEREDGAWLLLSAEEIEPWLDRLLESAKSLGPLPSVTEDSTPDPAASEAFFQAIWPTIQTITGSIFTLERCRQLAAQLKTYRNELFAADEKRAAGYAQAAMSSLEREDNPAENYFLNTLVFASVREYKVEEAEE